ncbi:MAG: hypothetical protein WAU82_07520 [Candidatus Binatus sp.]|uniref:hypothetical protein n=1 Tax=Candidatus Binatus sp. TaxID=2811406 RepID=UPI003BAF2145
MADDKDKELNDAVQNYLRALGRLKDLHGTGTATLLSPSPDNLKDLTTEQLLALIKNLGEFTDPKAAAQKKAAETNQVDEPLASEWFKQHWKDRNCPICKEVTWAMAPDFFHAPMVRIWRNHGPIKSFPCVVLTCRICGYTIFFNANVMQLLPEGSE